MGDPGVGKSRLFHEFKAVSQAGNLVLEAYSVSHGKASAYLPVTEMLRDYFRIVPEDDVRQRREKVAGKIIILDHALEDTLPCIYTLLGIGDSESPVMQMDTANRRRRTCEAIKRVLLRESLNQPVIMIFEDLHWIDGDTQVLLDMVTDSIASARVLLLVNYRPEYRHEWGGRTYYGQIRLDPLGHEIAGEMLTDLLGDAPELASIKRSISSRGEGNPFFIEEMVQTLFEQGVLVRNGAIKLAHPFSESTIPTTVQGILSSRIDRLAPKEKELLQTLAAIGRDFPLSLTKRVANCSDEELDQMLAHLQGSEFIYEQPAAGDVEYTFKHALTQGVAYNSLLIERRKQLHERIGQAMESLFVDRIGDYLKDIAYHYRRSGNTAKAIEYLRRAAEQAIARSFYEEAIEQLESALELLEKGEAADVRVREELTIRRVLITSFLASRATGSVEVQQNLERVAELCRETGDERLLALVLVHLFFSYWNKMDLEKAEGFARQALELAEGSADEYLIHFGNFVSGLYAAENGEYLSARKLLERACTISDQTRAAILGDPSIALGIINCIGHLAFVLWILGYPDKARQHEAHLVTFFARPLDSTAAALAVGHMLTIGDLRRDYRAFPVQAEDIVTRFIQSRLYLGAAIGSIALGRILMSRGNIDLGIEKINTGIRAFEAAGDYRNYCMWSYAAISACLESHRFADGLELLEGAISRLRRGGVRLFEADLYRLKGEFLLITGHPENEAESAFREAIAIAEREQAKSFELRATTCLARLLAKQGRRDEARMMLAEIYGWFTEGFDTPDLTDAKTLLDDLSS
jgi:tetratricopeptide (TPR) repeat protein